MPTKEPVVDLSHVYVVKERFQPSRESWDDDAPQWTDIMGHYKSLEDANAIARQTYEQVVSDMEKAQECGEHECSITSGGTFYGAVDPVTHRTGFCLYTVEVEKNRLR